jgi:hypothetical protein
MLLYITQGIQQQLKVLTWEDKPGLYRKAQCNHKGLIRGRQEGKKEGERFVKQK